MVNVAPYQLQLEKSGYAIIDGIFSDLQMAQLLKLINQADALKSTFRKSADLFAIRQLLKEVPEAAKLIFNDALKELVQSLFGDGYFVVKSIYFDKPAQSNWFVAYHQDLTISVDQKLAVSNYSKWTLKQNQFAVQPPLHILQKIYTMRIHLDHTDENNGALKVVPGSHLKGIYRPEDIDWTKEKEHTCNVQKGGVMIMKPLLLHSSGRTVNQHQRRVVHIEFCDQILPDGLKWAERMELC